MSPALRAYLLASHAAGPVAGPVLRRRLARGKEDAARLRERFGQAGLPRPAGRLVWIHAASVGEAVSALPLVGALRARAGPTILVTTGTVTSARRIAGLLPEGAVHQFVPVDTRAAVRRFLAHWRPDLAIWIESELWPRLVIETAGRRTPMALVNARLSEASFHRWRRLRGMARALLGAFRLILAQDADTVARVRALGAQARFAGNLKAAVEMPACDAEELSAVRRALDGRPAWLAASTHAGEEEQVLAAHRQIRRHPRPLLILAPRHPQRAGEVARLIDDAGLAPARRSAGAVPGPETDVWLADTLGEMGLWYRLAPVCFVGGSLVPAGGHTPFEPVRAGSAVLHGPHVANFAPAYAALDGAGGAAQVADTAALAAALDRLLADPAAAEAMRGRARAVQDGMTPDVAGMAAELMALMEAP